MISSASSVSSVVESFILQRTLKADVPAHLDLAFGRSRRPSGLPGERADQFRIGRRKFQRREILTSHPAHLLTDQRSRLAEHLASKEVQLDGSIGIAVCDGEDLGADVRLD